MNATKIPPPMSSPFSGIFSLACSGFTSSLFRTFPSLVLISSVLPDFNF